MIRRFVMMLGALALAFSLSGGASVLHHVVDHGADAGVSGCDDRHSEAETDSRDEPAPSPEDTPENECPVCVTVAAGKQVFTAPDTFAATHGFEQSGTVLYRAPIVATTRSWSCGPARAPPVRA